MESAEAWKATFERWPAELERRGMLVTSFGEQIPFSGFLLSKSLLLIDRTTPDTVGTRRVILPFDQIVALKITDVVKTRAFLGWGFDDAHGKQ